MNMFEIMLVRWTDILNMHITIDSNGLTEFPSLSFARLLEFGIESIFGW